MPSFKDVEAQKNDIVTKECSPFFIQINYEIKYKLDKLIARKIMTGVCKRPLRYEDV